MQFEIREIPEVVRRNRFGLWGPISNALRENPSKAIFVAVDGKTSRGLARSGFATMHTHFPQHKLHTKTTEGGCYFWLTTKEQKPCN